jgi:hypothetical protein
MPRRQQLRLRVLGVHRWHEHLPLHLKPRQLWLHLHLHLQRWMLELHMHRLHGGMLELHRLHGGMHLYQLHSDMRLYRVVRL